MAIYSIGTQLSMLLFEGHKHCSSKQNLQINYLEKLYK